MAQLPNPLDHRQADHEIDPLFVRRWSPRAMTGEPLPQDQLNRLFEAARWAPSTYNEQEWRYLYAHRDSRHWPLFLNLLSEPNQIWCKNAAVLVVCCACRTMSRNGNPNPVCEVDLGLSMQNLLLQAVQMGLIAHAMAGFDRSKAKAELRIPEDHGVHAMIAIGHPGDPDQLPEGYREGDLNPSGRKPISEIAKEGPFAF